ncbi:MAG: glycosyltransferase family 2 protein [Kiritimatiellae bacterium]|nr:glycosyltransferase family 2 protein [Kiritimatiellia bacterium]
MIDASVYMITKNEERFLRATLECLKDFKEVIVVDCGSTDATPEIAKSFANVKFFHHDWEGFARQKQWALDQCSCEWVVNVDADEHVTPELAAAINDTVTRNTADGLYFVISDVFMGRACRRWKISGRLHCFKKALASYDLTNEVHEGVIFRGGKVEKTKAAVLHYGIPDISTAVEKQNHYSSLKAKEKFEKGKKASIFKLLTIFVFTFLAQYFGKQNFRDGWEGLIRSQLLANYAFMKEAKLMSYWHRSSDKAIR